MKNFVELARTRCSIRSYHPDPISDDQLAPVLEAARLAPSATNAQPLQLVVVRRREQLDALAKAYPGDWFREAPAVIVICTLPAKAWTRSRYDNRSYADVDAAIAADHMTLAAADSGLGTCWIAAFDPAAVRSALHLPRTVEPLLLLTLGKPAEEGRPKTRKPLNELVRYESWKNE